MKNLKKIIVIVTMLVATVCIVGCAMDPNKYLQTGFYKSEDTEITFFLWGSTPQAEMKDGKGHTTVLDYTKTASTLTFVFPEGHSVECQILSHTSFKYEGFVFTTKAR